MKIRADRTQLAEALSLAVRAAATRAGVQVASGVRIDASDPNRPIELAATDLEISLRVPLEASIEEPGACVVPARLAQDIVRNLTSESITLSLEPGDGRLVISAPSGEYRLHTYPLDDFPRLPEIDRDRLIELDRGLVLSTIERVVRAASRDESRPVLTGVLVQLEPGRLTMAATDSYRLAVKDVAFGDPVEHPIDVILPARALAEVARVASSSEGVIAVGVGENQVVFGLDEIWLTARRIEGQFPNFRSLRPDAPEHLVAVPRAAVVEAVRRISVFTRNTAPARVRAADGELTIAAIAPDVGEAAEHIPASLEGDAIEIGFNAEYLRDGVELAEGDTLRIQLTNPVRPALLLGDGDEFWYVLMPMRLS